MASRKVLHLCVATFLLSLHTAKCYILLTANLEDVHAIAKQIAASPVANQLNKIIRRASSIFSEHAGKTGGANKIQQRADYISDANGRDDFDIWKPDSKKADLESFRARSSETDASDVSGESSDNRENRVERRYAGPTDLAELGKNASFYLKSIKKIFENV